MTKYFNKFIILIYNKSLSMDINVSFNFTEVSGDVCITAYLSFQSTVPILSSTHFWLSVSLNRFFRISCSCRIFIITENNFFLSFGTYFFVYLCFPIIWINRISELMTLLSHGILLWMFPTTSCFPHASSIGLSLLKQRRFPSWEEWRGFFLFNINSFLIINESCVNNNNNNFKKF